MAGGFARTLQLAALKFFLLRFEAQFAKRVVHFGELPDEFLEPAVFFNLLAGAVGGMLGDMAVHGLPVDFACQVHHRMALVLHLGAAAIALAAFFVTH